MIRCYYLGGQRIDLRTSARSGYVVRWLIDVWTAVFFVRENIVIIIAKCGRTLRLRRRRATDERVWNRDRETPASTTFWLTVKVLHMDSKVHAGSDRRKASVAKASHWKRWRRGTAIDWVPRGRPKLARFERKHGRLNVQSGLRKPGLGQPTGVSVTHGKAKRGNTLQCVCVCVLPSGLKRT